MEHPEQTQVQWRRDKIQEICRKGYSQRELSLVLQVGLATINRDISYLRDQAKTNIEKYIDERLPEEYEKVVVAEKRGYNQDLYFIYLELILDIAH